MSLRSVLVRPLVISVVEDLIASRIISDIQQIVKVRLMKKPTRTQTENSLRGTEALRTSLSRKQGQGIYLKNRKLHCGENIMRLDE